MLPESSGSSLLVALPDDIFVIISRFLLPRDIFNLSLCCKSLCALLASEKIWLTQCDVVGILSNGDLVEWRKGVSSYKALCRFLINVKPLIGIWVHQNPELGNVVYVMPGFVSVVGCRIIPQELGPLGIEDGPILWAPVFEIIGDFNGDMTFFLHGKEKGSDYFYPGSVKGIDQSCNVLLLEVQLKKQKYKCKLLQSKSFGHCSEEASKNVCRSNSNLSRSQRGFELSEATVPFSKLAFSDRRKLLEVVTGQVRLEVPDAAHGPLFPHFSDDMESLKNDLPVLLERRNLLLLLYNHGGDNINWRAGPELPLDPTQLELSEIRKSLDCSGGLHGSLNGDHGHAHSNKTRTLGGYFKDSIRQILGKSSSINTNRAISKNSSSGSQRHAQLHGATLMPFAVKDELPKCAWLISKMGRLTVGVQYEPQYGGKEDVKLKNLTNWSCAVGYGVGSGSPLSPSFNFGLELAKSSQFIASFYQHVVVQRRVKNPFEENEIVGITNYIDFGFELQTRVDDAKISNHTPESSFQVAASWQANKNFLLKGKLGPLSSTVSLAFKSWWKPSFTFNISATRDRTTGKTQYGFGLRVENLREASYQRADPNFVMLTPSKEHLAEGRIWKIGERPMLQSDINAGNFEDFPGELRPMRKIL